MEKELWFPTDDGRYQFKVTYTMEGIVYDLYDEDYQIVQEFGYDYYHELNLKIENYDN